MAKTKPKSEEEVARDEETGAPIPVEPLPADLPKGAHESKPVYDPVDDYPERTYAEASEGVVTVDLSTEEGRMETLQVVQLEDGSLTRAEGVDGPIAHGDYAEEYVIVDGQRVGYIAPKYD